MAADLEARAKGDTDLGWVCVLFCSFASLGAPSGDDLLARESAGERIFFLTKIKVSVLLTLFGDSVIF